MEIFERLYHFRTKILDIKKNEMADKLGMSPSNYGKCEDGTIQLNFEALKILSDLGMDLNWLITGKSPPQSFAAPPGADVGNNKILENMAESIRSLSEANLKLEERVAQAETRGIRIPKRNGTDPSAG